MRGAWGERQAVGPTPEADAATLFDKESRDPKAPYGRLLSGEAVTPGSRLRPFS